MTAMPSNWFLNLKRDKAANEKRRRRSATEIHLPLLSSPVETGFLITPADLSSSASDRSFTTKPKAVLNAENINSQTIPRSMNEPAKTAPANVAEVKPSREENRITL